MYRKITYKYIFILLLIQLCFLIGNEQLQNGRWTCPNNCGRTYKKKFSLNRHCQKECGVEPQYRCLICLKYFKRKESLKSHSSAIHKITYTSNVKNSQQKLESQPNTNWSFNLDG